MPLILVGNKIKLIILVYKKLDKILTICIKRRDVKMASQIKFWAKKKPWIIPGLNCAIILNTVFRSTFDEVK